MSTALSSAAGDRAESEQLAERLVRCLPAASFELETLVRLAGIVATRDVPTAAVECRARPRLLVNPDFVAAHCARDEHLFLLVMHELWHVILAHTRLYPRATPAENLALDAVINAGLARQHPGPEYRGFFEALNRADAFPELLLRPPEGWPERPRPPKELGRRVRSVLRRLYPPPIDFDEPMPLYSEILELLEQESWEGGCGRVVLVGDHGAGEGEARALDDDVFGGVVRRIVAAWPPPPFRIGGRDAGAGADDWRAALAPAPEAARRVFARLLGRTLGPRPGSEARRRRSLVVEPLGSGPLPNGADRLAPARRRLGLPPTLWTAVGPVPVRRPDPPASAHVYLDVSGSMAHLVPHLAGLVLPYVAAGKASVFQFSTEVEPLLLPSLRRGYFRTTGGTEVRCVLEHVLAAPRVRAAIVLTDGYVGEPPPRLAAEVRARRLRLHVVLPAEGAWRRDLEALAASVTVLPPLDGSGAPWRL
jgi:hypothetical protein